MTGKEIRTQREQMELTIAELAEALGVAPETLAQWEQEQSQPEHPQMLALALDQLAFQRITEFKGTAGRAVQQRLEMLTTMNAELRAAASR